MIKNIQYEHYIVSIYILSILIIWSYKGRSDMAGI